MLLSEVDILGILPQNELLTLNFSLEMNHSRVKCQSYSDIRKYKWKEAMQFFPLNKGLLTGVLYEKAIKAKKSDQQNTFSKRQCLHSGGLLGVGEGDSAIFKYKAVTQRQSKIRCTSCRTWSSLIFINLQNVPHLALTYLNNVPVL